MMRDAKPAAERHEEGGRTSRVVRRTTATNLWLAWCLCLVAVALSGAARAADPGRSLLVKTDGTRAAAAKLVEIAANWRATFDVQGERAALGPGELVRWGAWRERPEGFAVVLADAGVLRVEDWRLEEDELVLPEATTGVWHEARWSRGAARGVILQWPSSAAERDRLVTSIAAASAAKDEVWLADGDRLQGTLVVTRHEPPPGADPAEAEVTERWVVRTRAGEVPVSRERVVALTLAGEPAGKARRADSDALVDGDRLTGGAWLGLRDGTCVWARALTRREGVVELELAAGARLTCDAEALHEELSYLQPGDARIRYLSDQTPVGYKHVPFLAQSWEWRRDRGVTGGFLRTRHGLHRKGLGMHSSSRLAYDLAEGAEWFCAELAIDADTRGRGSVVFRVYLDDETGAWRAAYESPVVRGGAEPLPVRVDLRGARRLALIVDYADGGDEQDHADWLDARVIAK